MNVETTYQPEAPVTVLLEPTTRPTFDEERAAFLATILPDDIVSPQEYSGLAEERKRLKAFIARVEPEFDSVCADAHRAWKSACRLRGLFMDGLHALERRAGQLLSRYDTKQEEIRRAEERRLAEEERQRLLKQQREEAKLLEKQGHKEVAVSVRAQPVHAPAVSIPSATPKVEGLTYRDNWKWRPIGGDTPQNRILAISLMVPKDFREFVKLDDSALTKFAGRTKGTARVPGIEFYNERIPVQRG